MTLTDDATAGEARAGGATAGGVSAGGVSAAHLLDDVALIRRVFDHIDHGTTDLAASTWREPVANYLSPDRLAAEQRVLRRYPVPFCPVAALPEPGAYVARDAAGVPLVAVRGDDGEIRAFRNACRHRGTAVADGHGCASALVCPYHGWVYRLDGSLRQVPHGHGFPDLDRASHGLVPVATEVHGGIVFVTQDTPAIDGGLSGLPAVLAGEQHLLGANELVVDANWKVLLEGFLEGYHIKATHRTTFLPFGYDNLNVIEHYGRNSRVTFPFRRIAELRERSPETWRTDGVVTFVHHLFPNTIVAQLSHHTAMVVLEPLTPGRTKMASYRLSNRGPGGGSPEAASRDSEFVDAGAAEDRAMACAVQRGLTSGANEVVELGLFEGALIHFHRELRRLLDET